MKLPPNPYDRPAGQLPENEPSSDELWKIQAVLQRWHLGLLSLPAANHELLLMGCHFRLVHSEEYDRRTGRLTPEAAPQAPHADDPASPAAAPPEAHARAEPNPADTPRLLIKWDTAARYFAIGHKLMMRCADGEMTAEEVNAEFERLGIPARLH